MSDPVKKTVYEWGVLKKHVPPPLGGIGVKLRRGHLGAQGQIVAEDKVIAEIPGNLKVTINPLTGKPVLPPLWKGSDYRVVQTQLRHPVSGRKIPDNYPVTEAEYDEACRRAYSVPIGEGVKPLGLPPILQLAAPPAEQKASE